MTGPTIWTSDSGVKLPSLEPAPYTPHVFQGAHPPRPSATPRRPCIRKQERGKKTNLERKTLDCSLVYKPKRTVGGRRARKGGSARAVESSSRGHLSFISLLCAPSCRVDASRSASVRCNVATIGLTRSSFHSHEPVFLFVGIWRRDPYAVRPTVTYFMCTQAPQET